MKHFTNDEIINKFKDIFKEDFYDLDINIYSRGKNTVDIEVTQMYDSPCVSERILNKISDFFDTDNVDIIDDILERGCDTCDYGSKYGFLIRVWE